MLKKSSPTSDTDFFDKILVHIDSNEHIISNPYLHTLRKKAESTNKHNKLGVERFYLSIKFQLIFLVRVFQSIFKNKSDCRYQKSVKSDVLFVSHLTNKTQLLKNNDVYFGDLTKKLLGQGFVSSIVLLNHINISQKEALNGWKDSQITRFVLSSSLSFMSELKMYLLQRKSKKQLKSILKYFKLNKELEKDILCHHLSSGAFNSLRLAMQVSEIVMKTGVKCVITTYEGHAWERLVYFYVRKINPSIKCFGYQHAAVFKGQHSIKRPLRKKYNPDVILTSGLVAKEILEKNQLLESRVICVGSPKYSISSEVRVKSQSCLVVPEGNVSECLALFEFSLECAKQHPKQRFIWRLHPIISFKKLKKYSSIFESLPENVILSVGGFDNDISKCDSVLYRGSTAVLRAINAGLRPIYYQQSVDELNIDPIYTCQVGKFIVHNQEALIKALNKDVNKKAEKSLQRFSQSFYTPLDADKILKEIE